MNSKYLPVFRKLQELTRDSYDKQLVFLQHTLLVSSSVLSIVISLHAYHEAPLYIRAVFATSVILLTLGVLSGLAALYMQTRIPERGRQLYVSEHIRSMREGTPPAPAAIRKTGLHRICEVSLYISLPLSVILLAVYTVLSAFAG